MNNFMKMINNINNCNNINNRRQTAFPVKVLSQDMRVINLKYIRQNKKHEIQNNRHEENRQVK